MAVTVTKDPIDTYSRYVMITPEVPCLMNLQDVLKAIADGEENILAIVAVASDGTSEAVDIEQDEDGTWVVTGVDHPDDSLEELLLAEDGSVIRHEVYMPGFTSDEVPIFMVGVTDRRH